MNDILENLNAYCDAFIGESATQTKKKKSKTENLPVKVVKTDPNISEILDFSQFVDNTTSDLSIHKKPNLKCKSVEDKLRITSDTDKDNRKFISSDINDPGSRRNANLDLEQKVADKYTSNTSVTNDGFKIMSSLPSDDSDVSDAFDEPDFIEDAAKELRVKQELISSTSLSLDSSKRNEMLIAKKLETMKKPLLELIKHFDMEDKLYLNKKSELRFKKSSRQKNVYKNKKKCLSNKDITIIDYSHRKEKEKKEYVKPAAKTNRCLKDTKDKNISKEKEDFSFKQARNEIFKMGLSGFNKEERKTAKMDMLIRLGAKPPKNKAVNYKVLMEERKKKKEMERKDREEKRRMGLPVSRSVEKTNRNRDLVSIQNAPVGKFKDGVLTLSKKDIRKINNKR